MFDSIKFGRLSYVNQLKKAILIDKTVLQSALSYILYN